MVCKTMQMTRRPHRPPKALYAFRPTLRLVEKDLEGTCFRWDKPGGLGGPAAAVGAPMPARRVHGRTAVGGPGDREA